MTTSTKTPSAALPATPPAPGRVLTGERPTGPLHLGHYFGSIAQRVALQEAGADVFIVLADYQVITDRDVTGRVREHVHGAVLDYLAAGLDPQTTTIFPHSAVPALNQLMLPLLSLVSEAEMHRNPTVKTEVEASTRPVSGLLLTYPVHQAADILAVRGQVVPVGADNVPHVEQARVLARRFNRRYGPVLTCPEVLLGEAPRVPGLDGRKMSKSYGNAITLAMTADETAETVRTVRTDCDRHIAFDPLGRPGVSALLSIAGLCLAEEPQVLAERVGGGGSGALKSLTVAAVNDAFEGHRRRRAELAADPRVVVDVLRRGIGRASEAAEQTLDEVRSAMGTLYL